MKFRVEYTITDRDAAADVFVRAAALGGPHTAALSEPIGDGGSRITVTYAAESHYEARTVALVVQGDADADARIRRDSAMFPGRWYDLNEEPADV